MTKINNQNKLFNMKSLFLKVCYMANLVLVVVSVLLPFSLLLEVNYVPELLVSDIGLVIRGILAFLVVILWGYCIFIWAKYDKKIYRLFLILFLSSLYIVFYYRRILKEGWN